jgi:hypothetical protein
MINITLVALGLLIRWVFDYSEKYGKNKELSKPTNVRAYVIENIPRLVLTSLASLSLYCTLPSVFTALACKPCENHFSYLAMGYCNFEIVKYINHYLKK